LSANSFEVVSVYWWLLASSVPIFFFWSVFGDLWWTGAFPADFVLCFWSVSGDLWWAGEFPAVW
jgi:hypothetical protein